MGTHTPTQRPLPPTPQVKTYDESRAERELYEEALKEAARGSGYDDTRCQVCASKVSAWGPVGRLAGVVGSESEDG